MLKVFADYGLSAKSAAITIISLLLVIGAIASGFLAAPHALILLGAWGAAAFMLLPTRHLLAERCGSVRRLPEPDRRPARLIQVRQRHLFECAALVGCESKRRRVKDRNGDITVKQIQIPRYPKLSRPMPAPYGFYFRVELPGYCGITATKAVKNSELIDGYVSYLLRRTAVAARTVIEQESGSIARLEVRLRDEFTTIVLPEEVE